MVSRWKRDVSERTCIEKSGIVLEGRMGESGDGEFGWALCIDGRRKRKASGRRSKESASSEGGSRGGIVLEEEDCPGWNAL